jgi:SAM-dependent methyltransferase
MLIDVPSPIDLRNMKDAREWADSALLKRPFRAEFFAAFALAIATQTENRPARVLELGSGPGFLAEHLLATLPFIDYVALDFSAAMHQLASERLGPSVQRVKFVERSFRDANWFNSLGQFQHIVTNQAVHELRHKRYAPTLHHQARELLVAGGCYLVCDHFSGEGGMSNSELYMTVEEQKSALLAAGFTNVKQLLLKGGLVLHCAS